MDLKTARGGRRGIGRGPPPTPKQCFQMAAIKASEGLVKTHIAGLHPRVSACLEWSPRFRASNKFPGDGHAAGRTTPSQLN